MDHENSIESVHRYYVSLMYIRAVEWTTNFFYKHSQNILKKRKMQVYSSHHLRKVQIEMVDLYYWKSIVPLERKIPLIKNVS